MRLYTFLALSLGLIACADGAQPVITTFDRTPKEVDSSCWEVCRDRLDVDSWSTSAVDHCIDTSEGVACVLEPEIEWTERSVRLETLVVEDTGETFDCLEVCSEAILGHESDELLDCMEIVTSEGEPAALCAMKWSTPSSGGW